MGGRDSGRAGSRRRVADVDAGQLRGHGRETHRAVHRPVPTRGTKAAAPARMDRRVAEDDEPATRGRFRYALMEVPPKTEGSIRVLALPPSLLTVLKQHRTRQKKERLGAAFWADDDLVFTTPVGTAIDPQNVYKAWHQLCD